MSAPSTLTARRFRWSRWLTLALLSLCLPLQGVLAVTMQMDMALASSAPPAMHGAAMEHDMAMDMSMGMEMDMSDMDMSSHHHGHGADASMDEAMAGHHASAVPPDSGHGAAHDNHQNCSFCAQCCIGAMLPMAPLTIAHSAPLEDLPVATPAAVPERQPPALERPPKLILA